MLLSETSLRLPAGSQNDNGADQWIDMRIIVIVTGSEPVGMPANLNIQVPVFMSAYPIDMHDAQVKQHQHETCKK